ncbi:PspA/IM30 family protein [Bacillus infantis]|uniref:PspA/IM30 family protein n=1 Tax=Bacillus infantis TaxID=324767 RepID=UPI001CD22541|nr:PspA/IM30 family protein [Bacillus infantis]MCA1040657.1 PspA/IM30 family protein [Bacillus infantis]
MANVFTRLKNTIMADLHEAMDQKEQKNPVSLLNQYLRQCEQETEKVRKLLERQYSLKEEFAKEYKGAAELAEKRKRQAEVASDAGEAELSQFAVQEQLQYEERAVRLKQALEQASQQLVELERKYEDMKHKLKDMHIRRLELMGRENVTRANRKMDQVIDSSSESGKAESRFENIESYLDRLEQKVNNAYYQSTIDSKIALLEKDMKKKETHSIS